MSYKMPANQNLTGTATTTLELCEQGLRTATTRSFPLGKVGEVITFEGHEQQYRITKVEEITLDLIKSEGWLKQWSEKEQWTVDHFIEVFGGKTVHLGSFQTSFEKI